MAGGTLIVSQGSESRKKIRFTKRTRRGVRRQLRRNAFAVSSFSKAPMPNKFATKFRYVETTIDLNPGALGTAGVYVFSANGMFDPNITGVGHQPRGFDELMAMYDHYTVVGSKVTVSFSQTVGNSYYTTSAGIALKDGTTTYSDVNDYLEGRNVVSTVMASSTTDSTRVHTLSKTFSCKKFLGISHPLAEKNVAGNKGSNPSEGAFYHIFCAPLASVDDPPMRAQVRIDYLAVLTEPVQPNQS